MYNNKLIILLLVMVTSVAMLCGMLPAVTVNSNAQKAQDVLYSQMLSSIKKFGFVEVISKIAPDDYKSNLERLSNYAQANQKVLQMLTMGYDNENTRRYNSELPSMYEQEIKVVQEKLQRYPDLLKKTTFNQFSPFATSYVEDAASLKALFGTLEIKQENKPNKTQLNNSTTAIDAPKSWSRTAADVSSIDTGASGEGLNKIIGILDTGVDSSHPFLSGKVIIEACFSYAYSGQVESLCPNGTSKEYGPGTGLPCTGLSACSHGTHVAGIAAGNNGYSGKTLLNGVARRADIASMKVFSKVIKSSICSSAGTSTPCLLTYPSAQMDAMNYVGLQAIIQAIFNSPKRYAAINMSLGGGNNTANCDTDTRKGPMDMLKSLRIATVVAAGNGGQYGVATPACISTAIAVSSTDSSVTTPILASSSQAHASLTDISAPGASILSSIPGGSYGTKGGTSMAAPHVAGALAILHGIYPTHSVDNNMNLLTDITKSFSYTKGTSTYNSKRLVLCKDYYYYFGSWKCNPLKWWYFDFPIFDIIKK